MDDNSCGSCSRPNSCATCGLPDGDPYAPLDMSSVTHGTCREKRNSPAAAASCGEEEPTEEGEK